MHGVVGVGEAEVCLSVCVFAAIGMPAKIPLYFLLLPTAHSVWVGKLLTLWLGSPTGPVVHAPFHLPKNIMGAPRNDWNLWNVAL